MRTYFLLMSFLFLLASCGSDDGNAPRIVKIDEQDQEQMDENATSTTVPCENGLAGIYPCNGYDLLGRISLSDFDATRANDIWGWTDVSTGKEYAIMGLGSGTVFVDISDTENLIYLGKLPAAAVADTWRDVKVYQDHAFIVADNRFSDDTHGMQVFDLTRLRNVENPPQTFDEDARYTGVGRAHNIVINEDTGYAYVVGTNRGDAFRGGVHFIDIQDPKNPVAAGGYADNGYSHDAQVVTYNGPDVDYTGREIYIGANEDVVVIADVTDNSAAYLAGWLEKLENDKTLIFKAAAGAQKAADYLLNIERDD